MQRTPTCENCQRNYELQEFRASGHRIPLLLPCGHTFCEGCILKATKNKPEVSCFKCETKVQLEVKGEPGVNTLLPNIYLLGLLLYNRRIATDRITGGTVSTFNGIGNLIYKSNSSKVPLSSSSTAIPGDTAGSKTEDTIMCEECNVKAATCQCDSCGNSSYCEGCFNQVHKASKLLMKHVALPIEYSCKDLLSCSVHGRTLEFYDKDTSEAVCAICIISERCRGHDVVLLSDISNESGKLEEIIEKAKDTLFWWQKSSKILTKSLPEEYMEANQLFSDIQAKFNACHTILQKRQLEIMTEASEKLLTSGSIQPKLQELSDKVNSLELVLKDVEILFKDKRVMMMKSDEFIEKLDKFVDIPCIVQRTQIAEDNCFKLNLDEDTISTLEKLGGVQSRSGEKFDFLRPDEVNDDVKEQLKSGLIIPDVMKEEVGMNEILLDENLNKKVKAFSLLSGYNELVCVTEVRNPTDFLIQRVADKERLQVLMTDLNKHCRYANSGETLVYTVEEGQLLCAQFMCDNHWYRARVITKRSPEHPDVMPSWSNGLSVQVLYIDYGNTEWIPLTRLRQIPKQFLEVPEMAVTCTLTDIVPPCQSEEWPERSKKAFSSLTGDRPLIMNVRKRVGCKLYVDLRKPDDEEPTRDDDRPVSVRDALVFLEVASFISPASFPNSDLHQPVRKFKPHEPYAEGEFVDIMVTHIEDPEVIFIQNLSTEIHDEQSRLGIVYNSKNKKGWMIDYPYRNLVCSAKFSADNTWYRAKVLNVNHDDTVDVEYVDYGNCETVAFSDLRRIPDMYLEMPEQCIKVKLHGLVLPDGEETWSSAAKEFLHKFFLGKPLVAVIKSLSDSIPSIELYDTSTDKDIHMNELMIKFITKSSVKHEKNEDIAVSNNLVATTVTLNENHDGGIVVDYPCYMPPIIPNVSKFPATGVHVDDDAKIYVHVMDSDNSCLTDIMQDLNCDNQKLKKFVKSTKDLCPTQAVIAKFSQDDLWYRVEIERIIDEQKAVVRFIDFGNSEEADISNICVEPKFLEIPGQCISVSLDHVEPINNNGQWSSQVISLLREHIVSEVVSVELTKSLQKDVLKAIIYTANGININDALVKKKLAIVSTTECVVTEGEYEEIPSPMENITSSESADVIIHTSNYLWYVEPKLPNKGIKFDVMVTQVDKPHLIYIQRLPLLDTAELVYCNSEADETATEAYDNLLILESLSETMNSDGYFDVEQGLGMKPIVGMSCICKYTDDGLYYRAKVESLDEEEGVARLLYVDYGTKEVTAIENLKRISLDLINCPMQASKVQIAGLKPIEEVISSELMVKFYAMVANKRLVAEIIDVTNDVPLIHLYEQLEQDGNISLINIGEKMKEKKLAEFEYNMTTS